jgi:IS30 family transposase
VLYKHLSYEERIQIQTLLKEKLSVRKIAERLDRKPSTISREIKRNFWDACRIEYNSSCADRKCKERKVKANQKRVKKMQNGQIQSYTISHLKLGWSPEQIAGRISKDYPGLNVSHETIYQYVYKQGESLIKLLPRKKPKRQKRDGLNKNRKIIIPDRVSIDERPDMINKRIEYGHWESDSIVSKQSSASLNTMVERKSGYLKLTKIDSNTSANTKETIIRKMVKMPIKSITYDNGLENYEHTFINHALDCDSYFCHPYHSWEKGSVENTNGLIRRYLPKKTDFYKISDEEIAFIENLLNDRPRKRLKFLTPSEVLFSECCTST